MRAIPCRLDGLKMIEPAVYGDERGFFSETSRGRCRLPS
jgi:dTDP-4-dehydrorhamnose 3,5-epimerase-like enzyme